MTTGNIMQLLPRPRANAHDDESVDPCTDLANAYRLVALYGSKIRFVSAWGSWMHYDGQRWARASEPTMRGLGVEVARKMMSDALNRAATENADGFMHPGFKGAYERVEFARKTQDAKRLDAMVRIAASLPGVEIGHEQLDAEPYLLNVQNGTIDLRLGTLRPHDPADLITRIAAVNFDPSAQCPTWLSFLDRAMASDASLVAYLKRLFGYAITGDVSEQCLPFFFGEGANGKSTATRAFGDVLGEYAVRAPRGLLFEAKGAQHDTRYASLHKARFVTCSEVEEGAAFDEALIKDLTGGDPISARRMREDFWSFLPTHKLFLAGNHRPRVRGRDHGIWRRLHLVPWTVTITEAEKDPHLLEKLAAESEGILAWAIQGCLDWQATGLTAPDAVRSAVEAYRAESDPLHEFFDSRVTFEPEAKVARSALRASYEAWARENGAIPVGAKRFAESLRARGVTPSKVRLGGPPVDAWAGVRLV